VENIKLMNIDPDSEIHSNSNEALRESQRFLSTLISNLPGYVYRVQKKGNDWKMQFVSEGIFEMTGYHAYEFIKDSSVIFGQLVQPEDLSRDMDIVNNALKNKKPYQITYRIRTKYNKIKWVWEQGRGVYSENGELIATEGFITDITGKKITEEQILKRNEELSTLNTLGKSLSMLAKPDEIIELIFKMIGKLFNNPNLYIALYDESQRNISFPVYTVDGKKIKENSRTLSKGLTEHIIRTKTPLLINNNLKCTFENLDIQFIGKAAKSLLSVPILLGKTVFGVITIQDYQKENVFTESELNLLMTIAAQTAIALENALLFSALQLELDEKDRAEKKLKSSLREKEVLLKEVHHRVKNNLQIMSSLLRLQSKNLKNGETQKVFLESENRIKAMAIVHNKLYDSHSYDKIDFADYVKTLITNLFISLGVRTNVISYELNIPESLLNIDTAIPLGLIINELISNSLKYAFPDNRKGLISIILDKNYTEYTLIVKDDGIGIKEDINTTHSNTLGMTLVKLLSAQIDGKVETDFSNGTVHKIYFRELKYKKRT
jgi:PAS domain S-box-containing protein